MLNYDGLMERVGITPGETWFCGDNPPVEWNYQEAGFVYDDVRSAYSGRNQGHAALCLGGDINVNGLLLNHRDLNGTVWICNDIEGWWTLPPSEIPEVPKPYWDGNLLTTGRYTARQITVSGCFLPPDPSLVWYNRDALMRVASIVRGVGLIALCGNQSPSLGRADPFFDPPKMAVIQMADVPLVETIRPNGFTQFSLSFRCIQPTKLSAYERSTTAPVEDAGVTRERKYKAISSTAAEEPSPKLPTTYTEVKLGERKYTGLRNVNFDSLIPDETYDGEFVFPDRAAPPYNAMTDAQYQAVLDAIIAPYYQQAAAAETAVLHNAGNYFAFPVIVFDTITGVSKGHAITLQNLTTGEKMEVQKTVGTGRQLVIDTGQRRVAIVNPDDSPSEWVWDQRAALSLTSEWITLAPGDNTVIASKPAGAAVSLPDPTIYWRDTWIG
jgi:hypothetical protein